MRRSRTEAQTAQKYPHPLSSSSLLLLFIRSINWRASLWGRKMSLYMEQNANESSVNVCVIQVQNRAGWLTMRDSLYCNAVIQALWKLHELPQQAQILKINSWRRLFNKNVWPQQLSGKQMRALFHLHFFKSVCLKPGICVESEILWNSALSQVSARTADHILGLIKGMWAAANWLNWNTDVTYCAN